MNFLLFFVSITFSSIFYYFYTKSIGKDLLFHDTGDVSNYLSLSGNLFIEFFLFLTLGVILYLIFSSFDTIKQVNGAKKVTLKDMTSLVVSFFKKYLYYIGFFFFYLSIYIILSQLHVSFSYFVFIVSTVIFFLFFLANKFYLFRDFIKVNTILFSMVYIFYYIYSFLFGKVLFIEIDFINSFLILIFFILTIYSDNFLLKKPFSDKALTLYFFIYLFLFSSFYLFFISGNLSFTFALLGFIFSLFCFYLVPKLELFKYSIIPLRYFSLIFSYTGIIFSIIYGQSNGFWIITLFILFFSLLFNFSVHRKFINFVSLVMSFLSFWIFAFTFYFEYVSHIFPAPLNLLFYTFSISIWAILTPLTYKSNDIVEHYFFHTFSYIFNIVGVVYFFILNWFDIFTFWVILLVESAFVFFSYYKINSLKSK